MTDTHAPITGPLPEPMFDSGVQPSQLPNTEPHPAPIFDTGPHPDPLHAVAGHIPPMAIPARPVAVPGSHQSVTRWRFALIVAGVWALSAASGLGFYHWWYTSLTKTLPVLGILLYLMACMVASLLVSMVPNRPQVTAVAIALMAAPLGSVAAAALLHGAYYFEWIARPNIG